MMKVIGNKTSAEPRSGSVRISPNGNVVIARDLKKTLYEHYWNYFAAARTIRAELAANTDYVKSVLRDGAERARKVASVVLKRARKAGGLE